jgi:hypothetical protein
MTNKYSDAERERILREARDLLERKVESYVPPPELRYRRHDPPEPEPPELPPRLDIDIDVRIAQAIANEREVLLAIMAQSIGTTLRRSLTKERREQKAELEDEVRSLRIELCNLESTVAELRSVINAEKAKIIDLPNFRRVTN